MWLRLPRRHPSAFACVLRGAAVRGLAERSCAAAHALQGLTAKGLLPLCLVGPFLLSCPVYMSFSMSQVSLVLVVGRALQICFWPLPFPSIA